MMNTFGQNTQHNSPTSDAEATWPCLLFEKELADKLDGEQTDPFYASYAPNR